MLLSVLFTLSILGKIKIFNQSMSVFSFSSAFVFPAPPTKPSNTFYEVIVGQNSDPNDFSSNENNTSIRQGSSKEFGNNYNSDPDLVVVPTGDYFDVVYDNFSMLKDEKANKEDKVKERKRYKKSKKKKRRRQKNKRNKYRKKHMKDFLGSKLEYGEDYEEDYGGTMKFIPRSKLHKMKIKKNRRQKKRRRRKKKDKRRNWRTITLNK